MDAKITVNGQSLSDYLSEEITKEIKHYVSSETRKYWKRKSPCRYNYHKGHSKIKVFEDWEIFVFILFKMNIDITTLNYVQLRAK